MGKFRGALDKYKRMPVAVKAALWYMVCNFFQKGISTLTTPIFTRLMSTEQYGQYTLFVSWQSILIVIITLKLSGGVYQQGLVKFEDKQDKFTSSLLGLSTTLVIAWGLIYTLGHRTFNSLVDLNTPVMVAMFVSIIATCAFELWAYRQRMDYKYIPMVVVTVLVGMLKPITGIIAVLLSENKGEARILSLVAVEAITYLFIYISIFAKNKTFYDKKIWKYAVLFNLPLIPHFLSQSILIQSDRIMIDSICGKSYVGMYGLAYSISMLMSLVNNAVKDTLNPWIYKSIKERKYKELRHVSSGIILIIAILDLLVIALAPELIKIFAPASYYEAVWVIPPVSMSIFFTFLYCFFADFEYFYEKTKFIMASSLGSALLNILLNYIFIRKFGYVAAGYTTLVSYIVYSLFHYICYRRIVRKELDAERIYDDRKILLVSIVFLASGLIFAMLYNYIFIRIALIGCLIFYMYRSKNTFLQLLEMRKSKTQ